MQKSKGFKRFLRSSCTAVALGVLTLTAVFAAETTNYRDMYKLTEGPTEITIDGFKMSYLESVAEAEKKQLEIYIPTEIDGKAVVGIGSHAFSPTSTHSGFNGGTYEATSLIFEEPSNLKNVAEYAFYGLDATGDLVLPNSIETMGDSAFRSCTFDGTLTLPENAKFTTIATRLTSDTPITALTKIPASVTEIGSSAFSNTKLSGHFDIPEGVNTVGGNLFYHSNVTSITFPSTITHLSEYAFAGFIHASFIKVNFNLEDVTIIPFFSELHGFWSGGSDNPDLTVILDDAASYAYALDITVSQRDKFFSYPLTLNFDGLDPSSNREVLYNRPICWEQTDASDDCSWEIDPVYHFPAVSGTHCWNFANAKAWIGDPLITPLSVATGSTLYNVEKENVADAYVGKYYEFGTYPQTMFAYAPKDTSHPAYIAALANVSAAEAEGRTFTIYESTDSAPWIYWFENEPILWRHLGNTTIDGATAYAFWSEYVLAQRAVGDGSAYSNFSTTPLFTWLNGEFTQNAFAPYERNDFLPGSSTMLLTYPMYQSLSGHPNYLKSWKADYASYIGSSTNYWLSYAYTTASNVQACLAIPNSTGVFTALSNNDKAGIRPLTYISPDFEKYTTTTDDPNAAQGTFDNPYRFILKAPVINSLGAGTYTEPQKFELTYPTAPTADIIYIIQIDGGEEQIYDPAADYYISKDCTLTAWVVADGCESVKTSWDYIVTNPLKWESAEAGDDITIGGTPYSKSIFDIIKIDGIDANTEKPLLDAALPSGLVSAEEFHLYATLNGKVMDSPVFAEIITISLDSDLTSTSVYKLLHLLSDDPTHPVVSVYGEKDEDGALMENEKELVVDREKDTLSFAFDLTNLSPFMLAEKKVSSGGGTATYYTSTLADMDNGSAALSATRNRLNATVTVSTTPDEGYEVDSVTVSYGSERTVSVTDLGHGRYSYKQPGASATVTVTFVRTIEEEETPDVGLNRDDHLAYMLGYTDDTFRPDNNITRAEATVMFSRLLTNEIPANLGAPDFVDMTGDEWCADAVAAMAHFGIITGYPDGTFGGNQPITRAEFAAIASRFDDLAETDENIFSDVPADSWALCYINSAAQKGWITGYPDGTFKPTQYITRSEAVALVNRVLERSADSAFLEAHLDTIRTFSDVPATHWAYEPILEATNSHDYSRNQDGSETWIALQ